MAGVKHVSKYFNMTCGNSKTPSQGFSRFCHRQPLLSVVCIDCGE
jgi:hypothetical protein